MLFPAESLPKSPPIETREALLLIDFINDFIDRTGKVYIPKVRQFMNGLPILVDKFRSRGDIIWIRTEHHGPRSSKFRETGMCNIVTPSTINMVDVGADTSVGRDQDVQAFLDSASSAKPLSCQPGSHGARYPEFLVRAIAADRDINLMKTNYSAFTGTNLLTIMRTRKVTRIFICGSLSNVSVYATVMDAVGHGINVSIIEDCLGYLDRFCHDRAVQFMMDHMGVDAVTYHELMQDLNPPSEIGIDGDYFAGQSMSVSSNTGFRQSVQSLLASRPQSISRRLTGTEGYDGSLSCRLEHQTRLNDSPTRPRPLKSVSYSGPERKRSCKSIGLHEQDRPLRTLSNSEQRELSQISPSGEPSGFISAHFPVHQSDRPSSSAARLSTSSTRIVSTFGSASDNSLTLRAEMTEVGLEHPGMNITSLPIESRSQRKKKLKPSIPLKTGDAIGEGDARLIFDIMPFTEADNAFDDLKTSVQWQKMFHRTGEVPRLVAVQGEVSELDHDIPIYRHPADESPELHPFDSEVDKLRQIAERLVGHKLNHVLIQWYRNGEDNISEHSDKTLDIVHDSSIVNLSLGAQRTMTLRTKKSLHEDETMSVTDESVRKSQRIPLPHNSLFVLGLRTNQSWLHSIRADKRPPSEKSPEELAFNGERISLTFRQIGTFINTKNHTIWGQGATSKTKAGAMKLLDANEAEREGERMIRAFGQENHRSKDWNWDEWYGRGFDVVNFVTKAA